MLDLPTPLEILLLFILPMPIASMTWTITHEELMREVREWCKAKSEACPRLYQRKALYVFTCEYCLSHYITALVLLITRYHLFYSDWRGYLVSGFSLVWIANIYMSFYGRIRLEIRRERVEIDAQRGDAPSKGDAQMRVALPGDLTGGMLTNSHYETQNAK